MPEDFWLNDMQQERLAPFLRTKSWRVARVCGWRVTSGITLALQPGGCWIEIPADYGLRKTVYHRFVHWASKGVWRNAFIILGTAEDSPATVD